MVADVLSTEHTYSKYELYFPFAYGSAYNHPAESLFFEVVTSQLSASLGYQARRVPLAGDDAILDMGAVEDVGCISEHQGMMGEI